MKLPIEYPLPALGRKWTPPASLVLILRVRREMQNESRLQTRNHHVIVDDTTNTYSGAVKCNGPTTKRQTIFTSIVIYFLFIDGSFKVNLHV